MPDLLSYRTPTKTPSSTPAGVPLSRLSRNRRRSGSGACCASGRALALVVLLVGSALATVAGSAHGQVTLDVVNNFSASLGGEYFGGHVESEDVYLYFTGIGANPVTYNGGAMTVTAEQRIQLSSVTNGSFSLSSNIAGARVYAVLGSDAPVNIPSSGPDSVAVTTPYSYIELTTQTNGKADQSFINQVSFPTSLSNGSQTNSWSKSATSQSIATSFNTAFPSAPYAPAAGVAPGSGSPYDPYSGTTVNRSSGSVQTPIDGHRLIGPSNQNLPAASAGSPQKGTGYTNVPGFNDYLGWLQSNQPAAGGGNPAGWKISYNSGISSQPGTIYTGYLAVTGTDNNYGIELSDFTYGGTLDSSGDMTGGTSVTGTISYAANNSQQTVYGVNDYTGNWTDMIIFGADDPTGTAVITSGDIGALDVSSVLYTVSGSIGAGILGSDAYITMSMNTDHFFQTGFTPTNALTDFFTNSLFGGAMETGFYDKYWYTMLSAGGLDAGVYAGYFTPYDDHFNNLGVQITSDSGTLTWELGTALVAVPEPGAFALLGLAAVVLYFTGSRRRSCTS